MSDDYASAYYGGKAVFEQWKMEHEMQMSKEQAESAVREFLGIFKQMFPQQYEDLLRKDPDARKAARMFGQDLD